MNYMVVIYRSCQLKVKWHSDVVVCLSRNSFLLVLEKQNLTKP
jgi:hypothetical protein